MSYSFTPDQSKSTTDVPFIEDAQGAGAKYYSTTKSLEKCETAVRDSIALHGGHVASIVSGLFNINGVKRHGYLIDFSLGGNPGQITVLGFPMRKTTEARIKQVKRMALLNVAESFQSAFMCKQLMPGSNPLIMHLLVNGETPLHEILAEQYQINLPDQPELPEIVDADFHEISGE